MPNLITRAKSFPVPIATSHYPQRTQLPTTAQVCFLSAIKTLRLLRLPSHCDMLAPEQPVLLRSEGESIASQLIGLDQHALWAWALFGNIWLYDWHSGTARRIHKPVD
jgi:hypothetical protein